MLVQLPYIYNPKETNLTDSPTHLFVESFTSFWQQFPKLQWSSRPGSKVRPHMDSVGSTIILPLCRTSGWQNLTLLKIVILDFSTFLTVGWLNTPWKQVKHMGSEGRSVPPIYNDQIKSIKNKIVYKLKSHYSNYNFCGFRHMLYM